MNSTLVKDSTCDNGRQFLNRFPQRERSLISNHFLDKIRGGSRTMSEILHSVHADVEQHPGSARRYRDAGRIDELTTRQAR